MSETKENTSGIFTVCNIAYLAKALALGESLAKVNENKLNIVIFDEKRSLKFDSKFVNIFWIEDFSVPQLRQLAFIYDITEFSTSLKAFLAKHFLSIYTEVIFLDPDIYVYDDLNCVRKELAACSILLTPHYITPKLFEDDNGDLALMRFGSFNLGFFAVKRSETAYSFLSWWDERCQSLCYFESQFGLSTDQKWVTIAPCFFSDINISFNMGLNVAMWNLHERSISVDKDRKAWVNRTQSLIFVHYSSFNKHEPERLSTRNFHEGNNLNSNVIRLANEYANTLNKYELNVDNSKYSYDYMSNGNYISPTLRRAYACVRSEMPIDHDPFDSSGVVGKFAKKNGLIAKHSSNYHSLSFGDIGAYRKYFIVINFVMRVILRVIGPIRFSNFSRLLVYLSIYRSNRDLWKL